MLDLHPSWEIGKNTQLTIRSICGRKGAVAKWFTRNGRVSGTWVR
jgi:hypothetical protein